MSKLIRTLQKFFANVATLGLLAHTIAPYSIAIAKDDGFDKSVFKEDFDTLRKSKRTNGGGSVSDIMSAITGTGQSANQYMQIQQQMAQAQQQQIEMQKLQMTLTPKESPDDFFPQCKILPSKADSVAGLCESPLGSDQELAEAMAAYQAAKQNQNLYDNHLLIGNKAGDDQGLQCLNENAQALRSQLYERLKQIDALKRELAEHKAAFETNIQRDENQLKELNGLLNGGDGFEFDSNSRDLSGLFRDPACTSVKDFQVDKSGKAAMKRGLLGIRDEIENNGVKESREFLTKKDSIVKEFKNDLSQFVNNLSRGINNGSLPNTEAKTLLTQFRTRSSFENEALQEVIARTADEHTNDQQDLKNELTKMGVPSELSKAVTGPINNLERQLFVWERDQNNTCFARKVTNNLDTFKSSSYERNGRIKSKKNIDTFYNSISSILSSTDNPNLTMDERIELIRKKQAQYGFDSIAVNLNASVKGKATNAGWKIADAFAAYADDCKSEFNTRKNSNGFSNSDIKSRVTGIRSKYQKNQKELAMNLAARLQKTFLDCDGIEYNATPEDCSKNKLDTSNAKFCMKQSLACAQSISACFAKADTIVKAKQFEQRQLAKAVNKKIMDFRMGQYNILKKVEAQYKGTAAFLKQYFPGTNFEIPFKITANPQNGEYSKKHGVSLMDTKNFMKDMEENLTQVAEAIKKQNKEIIGDYTPGSASSNEFGGTVGEKIDTIKKNYEEQRDKVWGTLADNCQTQIDNFIKAKNDAAQKANEQVAEQNEAIRRFCSKIQTINSTPGCGKVSDLTDEAFEIADEIGGLSAADSKKLATLSSYQALCEESQAHDEENSYMTTIPDIDGLCEMDDYKDSRQCQSYIAFHEKCTPEYYAGASLYEKFKDLGTTSGDIESACKDKDIPAASGDLADKTVEQRCESLGSQYKLHTDEKCYKLTEAKFKLCKEFKTVKKDYPSDYKKISMCGEDQSEKAEKMIEIQEPLEKIAVSLENNKKIKELREEIGEQSYQVCNAQSTNSRTIAKEFGDDLAGLPNFTTASDI